MRGDCWDFDREGYSSVSVRYLMRGGLCSSRVRDASKDVAKDSILTAPSNISD